MSGIAEVFSDYHFNDQHLTLLAGPCAIESYEVCAQVAEQLKNLTDELKINFIFKSSFDKANRSSGSSDRGAGLEKGLAILDRIKKEYQVPIVTDVHESYQCQPVAEVADVLQIPAYLSRQTDLLVAAAKTGRVVNIKKAQFMAAGDLQGAIDKVIPYSNKILLTERGTMFGYHQQIVDMTNLLQLRQLGYPVIYDATHSVQVPGGHGNHSGGNRDFAFPLMRAALTIGVAGIFAEVHPNPPTAISDADNQLYLNKMRPILTTAAALFSQYQDQKESWDQDGLL
ncbi:MAG: 3-deoxy-8-phosphooctulonate synthase [Liquorilactobacillus nagelii]|jgi:2-dehydro-3-deoxyphosphooctonate aldolase (KDO 8-P synthase)|uniref:3-deoxy-8-phosphooctulonate synthase n=1 Tax=Liquorilactobacillus nagelii TaxID=82688 RepID=A0A3Q8CNS9_9LACO|nr:3-deoxy-8-phosphooctulonate synthase [Liquorilactobacillus nagelii]AUJ31864.1 3-deoxy-8-phosphooctulonate synthase [Liquorilactobacillus nagelii]KRL41469.1 3-deoxy-8-phosphooctulonate synthase [Liquorilactobacillus nagelii DSM 13675]MCC7615756.1 3-deoxy-8-phosphooctulonate synthase [Liquorilactobacillus nagelii]MCI1632856.1 3-deoxy-8-phosphooctulonate synthase [Liquorilactobacillus nagelii]MCI1700280.1 3-deoxy-8-phosphooctulonate synthase [Liquorilactobacillus nagelii]